MNNPLRKDYFILQSSTQPGYAGPNGDGLKREMRPRLQPGAAQPSASAVVRQPIEGSEQAIPEAQIRQALLRAAIRGKNVNPVQFLDTD